MAEFQIMSACECGNHKMKPRYDSARVGEAYERKYVCDVCTICGHQVPRPFAAADMLAAGVVTADEVRQAMVTVQNAGEHFGFDLPLEGALGRVIASRTKTVPESE